MNHLGLLGLITESRTTCKFRKKKKVLPKPPWQVSNRNTHQWRSGEESVYLMFNSLVKDKKRREV